MSRPIIEVRNLSKRYNLGAVGATSLREEASRLWDRVRGVPHPDAQEFWALRDVSFDVQPGEVVGVIGRNGAGKSTLLKILSRITEPTGGRAVLRGRVASLLEVGTGFHPELTGRENVFLNGAILGMSRAEVRKKFDEIVAFAEVDQFIDTPVKRYSSGMYVRLAFAVAAHLEPEILIVDEVLAVGDAQFQQKCLGKMHEVSARGGRTVLFVSHNMAAVRNLCLRGIVLDRGHSGFDGPIDQSVAHFARSWNLVATGESLINVPRRGTGDLQFTRFRITAPNGEPLKMVPSGSDVRLVFGYRNATGRPLRNVNVGFGVHGIFGERLFVLYASHLNSLFTIEGEQGEFSCLIHRLPLNPGRYTLYPRIEVSEVEADFPQVAAGVIEVTAGDFYRTGRAITDRGECPFIVDAAWSEARQKSVFQSDHTT